ncbi:MAG: nitroreductase [Candidatus Altiarchaeales archaeon HGW-Altiarchaeales-1]|nr:MAG: nitroreductase [Candidatus Altiarchaeales archaeon HGW-Altiarchaeales-1]
MEITTLPEPKTKGKISFEEAIFKRKSHRKFTAENLSTDEISQLLWAAYGRNKDRKVVPSAGATYPFEIYINLSDGIYKYESDRHKILKVVEGNKSELLYYAALHQECVKNAKATIILAVNYEKIKVRYGDRSIRYTHFEAGHIAQNICLQAEALNLGSVCIGAFDEEKVAKIINLDENLKAIYMICVSKI